MRDKKESTRQDDRTNSVVKPDEPHGELCIICEDALAFDNGVCRWESCEKEAKKRDDRK